MNKICYCLIACCGFFLLVINIQKLKVMGENRLHIRCSLGLINTRRVKMNDQCVLNTIKSKFLSPKSHNAYDLNEPGITNPSMGQAQLLTQILNNKKKGFFVECGALDGETRSNTLYMERFLGWEGVLIEADPFNYKELLTKHRKAWTIPACLSIKPYPSRVNFKMRKNRGRISKNQDNWFTKRYEAQVQCFPLYSILLALNQTTVDYFSLDVEGDELDVLRTIPFEKVDIRTLSVEFIHSREGKEAIREHMEQRGYQVVQEISREHNWANDFIFVKQSL